MKTVAKGDSPEELRNWIALAEHAEGNWTPSFGILRSPEKPAVHRALLEQQLFVCAYCGRRLASSGRDSHIEHFWPQSKFRDWDLEWWNLFASCGPPKEKRQPTTCGDAKKGWTPAGDFILPSDPECEQKFAFNGMGEIVASAIGGRAAEVMIEKLALGEASLVYERLQVIQGIERDIMNGEIAETEIGGEVAIWRSRDAEGGLKSFSHVVARYLEEEYRHALALVAE